MTVLGIRPVNIWGDFFNTPTIFWAAMWAVILHYVPVQLWKNRKMIVKQVNNVDN